jgi:hypothetical protein
MDRPDDVHGPREFAGNTNPLIKFHGCMAGPVGSRVSVPRLVHAPYALRNLLRAAT